MKQRTRSMGFLKTIFDDGVDCILTPGKFITNVAVHILRNAWFSVIVSDELNTQMPKLAPDKSEMKIW